MGTGIIRSVAVITLRKAHGQGQSFAYGQLMTEIPRREDMANMITFTSKTAAIARKALEAAAAGNQSMLFELIDHQFNLEDCDEAGNSILHYAVTGGNPEIVKFLVEVGGLSPAWANQELITPYDLAHNCSLKTGSLSEIELYFKQVCGFAYDECYRNPVRRGMHPDPSIVRVGEDYYMVNSSFIFSRPFPFPIRGI